MIPKVKYNLSQDKVFVALSKRVALSLWVVALLPQLYEFFSKRRLDDDTHFGPYNNADGRNLCYATYVYKSWIVSANKYNMFNPKYWNL